MINMRIEIFGVVSSEECLSQLEAAALYCNEVADDLSPASIREYILGLGADVKPLVMDIEGIEGDMQELRACLRSLNLGYRCSYAAADADQYDSMIVFGPTLGKEETIDLTRPEPNRSIQDILDEIKTATPEQRKEIDRRDLISFLRTTDAGINFDVAMSEKFGVVRKAF
jgi:hypothetical protein